MIPSIILGAVLLTIGLILKYFHVQRNSLFGYRTFLSMKNDENWVFANKAFAKYAVVIGTISISVGLINMLVVINIGYILFGILSLLLLSIIAIEVNLRKFDKGNQNGN